MEFCEDIDNAKACMANMAYSYAKACTYGRETPEALMKMKVMNAYIKTLERNLPSTKGTAINIKLDGVKVSHSSLRREKNTLILDTVSLDCIDVRPCLSDEEICSVVELTQVACSQCCN